MREAGDSTDARAGAGTDAGGGLHRRVGFLGAAVSGVAIVLGAGIYVLIGEAAGIAGDGVWASFVVAALLAAGTGLSYAELTSMFPEAGAAAAYAKEAFGARVAFVTGWMDIAVNGVAAPAVALGFGSYLAAMTGIDRTLIAVVVLLVCAAIVLLGVVETVSLAGVFALIEVGGLLFVIALGAPHLGSVDLLSVHGGTAGLLGAAALVFFAYEGFEEIATLSEEVSNPTRTIPAALLTAVAVTTVVYVAVASVVVSVVPWEELAASEAPLAVVVERLAGSRYASGITLIALFATFNTVLLVLATGARAVYGMARRGLLPAVMGRVWPARGTPWIAILAGTAVAIAFALTGDLGFVAQVTNFAVFTLFVVVNASVMRLRILQPDRARPFRVRPAILGVPLPSLAGLLGAVGLAWYMERSAILVGGGALALGLVLSFAFVRRTPAAAGGDRIE
ncbi:MAG: APC family permease [Dehalococcoidia bacterium]